MITKYKLFETQISDNVVTYWKVETTEPNLYISMKKIGAPIDRFKFLFHPPIGTKPIHIKYPQFILLVKYEEPDSLYWDWDNLDTEKSIRKIYKNLYDMGIVRVTKEDIEDYKLEREADKYNL